jgi:hypothetical protein
MHGSERSKGEEMLPYSDDDIYDFCRDVCLIFIDHLIDYKTRYGSIVHRDVFKLGDVLEIPVNFYLELTMELYGLFKELDAQKFTDAVTRAYLKKREIPLGETILKHYNDLPEFLKRLPGDILMPPEVANFFFLIMNTRIRKNVELLSDNMMDAYSYGYADYSIESRTMSTIDLKVRTCMSRFASDCLCVFRPMSLANFVRLLLSIFNPQSSHVVFDGRSLDDLGEDSMVCCAFDLRHHLFTEEPRDECAKVTFDLRRGLHVPSKKVALEILRRNKVDVGQPDDEKLTWLRLLLANDVRIDDGKYAILSRNGNAKIKLLRDVFIPFSEKLHERLGIDGLVRRGSNSIPFMLQYFDDNMYTDNQLKAIANCAGILPGYQDSDLDKAAVDKIGNRLVTVFGDQDHVDTEGFPDGPALERDVDVLLKGGNRYLVYYHSRHCFLLPSEVDRMPDDGRETLHVLISYFIKDRYSTYDDENEYIEKGDGLYVNVTQYQDTDHGAVMNYRGDGCLTYNVAILDRPMTPRILKCFTSMMVNEHLKPLNLKYAIAQFRTDHTFVNFPYNEVETDPVQQFGYYKNLALTLLILFEKMNCDGEGHTATTSGASIQWIRLRSMCTVHRTMFDADEHVLYEISFFPTRHTIKYKMTEGNIDDDYFRIMMNENIDAILEKFVVRTNTLTHVCDTLRACAQLDLLNTLTEMINLVDGLVKELSKETGKPYEQLAYNNKDEIDFLIDQ